MYSIAFAKEAQKEFLKLQKSAQELVAIKIKELENGNFTTDRSLKGKHKGKYRKRAGDYRIIYLREDNLILITLVRIAHRKEVY
ncbi:MAG: type II toxin-antitoxin system RelE/ParE family toxin [Epsilonproteobacteria bacterium]|nr:type II toxin-antitoxin system RelE/ParE family toxin [Campylobacterota bacterium]